MNAQRKVNILDITYYLICPPISGGALRMIAPYTKMSPDCGLEVDFLFSTYNEEQVAHCRKYLLQFPVIKSVTGAICPKYNCFTGGMPEDISPDVYTTIAEELKDKAVEMVQKKFYDVIQIEHSQLSWIVPYLRIASPDSKIVLDLHNAEYRIFETWLPYATKEDYPAIKKKRDTLKAWEEKVWKWYDSAFTVSPIEQELFRQVSGTDEVFQVPTGGGIDPEKYAPKEKMDKPHDILYLGTMNWFPNAHGLLWFLDHIFPKILEKRPGTKLYVAGYGDPNSDLCKRAVADPNIEFLGQVKDDVYYFQTSKVFIVPLWIGAGARVKIPTAWASKLPIVSTTFGAEGAEAIHGHNIMLADDADTFAECVLKLLEDEEYARQIAENAYQTLCKKYSLQYCADLLVDAYHQLAASERDTERYVRKPANPERHLDVLIERYPELKPIREKILSAYTVLRDSYEAGGKLLAAGNGGSCADAEHIVGELMKGFVLPRPVDEKTASYFNLFDAKRGPVLAERLQQGLPAIALSSHPALNTAFSNDVDADLMYAQQLYVLGRPGDVFLGISTSGNAKNVHYAAIAAKAKGMKVIALTGKTGGVLAELADVDLIMPSNETYQIQELHLPVYHCLCLMLEEYFFGQGINT